MGRFCILHMVDSEKVVWCCVMTSFSKIFTAVFSPIILFWIGGLIGLEIGNLFLAGSLIGFAIGIIISIYLVYKGDWE